MTICLNSRKLSIYFVPLVLIIFNLEFKNIIMKFLVDKQDQYVVVEVQEEEINSMNAPKLKSEFVFFNTEGFANIILDLKLVKFVDSSGLSAILVGNRLCKDSSGVFALTNIGDQVGKLIKISQLENILNIYPTTQEAKDALDKMNNE